MIFENPGALWLLLALPPVLLILGLWGWKAKKEAASLFLLDLRRLRKRHIEKYIISGVLMALLIVACALPEAAFASFAEPENTGEVFLMVDVSTSMAAQKYLDSPSRLERVKSILYNIINSMEELGKVQIALYGFTDRAESFVPLVSREDYSYLKESIEKVLDINASTGNDTSLGQPILDIAGQAYLHPGKFSLGEQAKIIIIFSDGELFYDGRKAIVRDERLLIDQAIQKSVEEGIKVITVGVGEREGAKIPIYDDSGIFTGQYSQLYDADYISYLEEDVLKEIATRTEGEYFSEGNVGALTKFIEDNLSRVEPEETDEEVTDYHSIAAWFILGSVPIWIVFVRRHLLD